ncbi:hypothetical protein WICMUC_004045 [Wickerhamomyces mucosus]|uniref:Autophagy-related protein 6 n=1 Tax=Wickerhamomyces mucosus TaxID=1378264 RepID=A0A9P8PI99_9ASCO|nr:hypothetical protein WICMUC_004045 [Wickerhamomyces mucosus]
MSETAFNCQRCKLPLHIDTSFKDLSNSQLHLLASRKRDSTNDLPQNQSIPKERLQLLNKAASSAKSKNSNWPQQTAVESFVILPQFSGQDDTDVEREPQIDDDNGEDITKVLSTRVNNLSKIFNILSFKGAIDYPVCKDCAQILLANMKTQYEKISKERDIYLQFLEKLQNKSTFIPSKSQDSLKEIDDLKLKELERLNELKLLEDEKNQLDNEIKSAQDELSKLNLKQQERLLEKNLQELKLRDSINKRDQMKVEYEYNLSLLQSLRKTNIYNETFHISHDGRFGTINGLRLGSLESIKVPWPEINAALGNVVLLLATIAARLNLKLEGYKLKPVGSTSKIEKLEIDNQGKQKVIILECYSSGEYQIERLFNHSKLDNSMVAILEILKQILDKLLQFDDTIELPYKMENDKIGNASIQLLSKIYDEEWTSACKFLLTNLKWILAYASAHIPAPR